MRPGRHKFLLGGLLPAFLFLFAFPANAHAHTTIKGVGELVSGLVHPLTTPTHLLILLGLGLLVGQQTPLNLKTPMQVFMPLSAAALLLTMTGAITGVYQPVLVCLALGVASLVALEQKVPSLVLRLLFAAAAIAIGFDSAPEAASLTADLKTILGTWISLIFVLCDLAIYVSYCSSKKWLMVGVRIIGSWIIAISLLVLAFSLKK